MSKTAKTKVLLGWLFLLASGAWASSPESVAPFSADVSAILAEAGAPPKPGEVFYAQVLKVLDADTVVVDRNGELIIRLSAVDAPETAHPEHGKLGQPYGDEAAAFARTLCEGKTVKVTVAEIDKFGRTIGAITLRDGRSLQEELLRGGWAWWNFFFSKDSALNALENEAIKAGRGLWAGKTIGGERSPEAPWVFRRRVAAGVKRVLPGEEAEFTIKRLSDGDTAALGTRQGVYDYIRLAGVDAPEIKRGKKPGQPYGPEAGVRAAALVAAEGMTVRVKIEDVDPYGRIVGWIHLKSRNAWLNEVLVEEGLSWWYERYYPDLTDIARKQEKARAARRGLWADANPVPPWDYRRSQREPEAATAEFAP